MLRERPERGRGTGCVHRQCVTRETLSSAPARVPASAPAAAPAPTCEGSTEPSTPSDWNVLSRENILNTHASQACQLGTLLMRSCVRSAPANARVSSAAGLQPLPYPIKPLFFVKRNGFRARTKSFLGQGVLVGFLKASVWARLVSRETTRDRTTAAVVKGAGETARPLAGTRRRTPTMQPLLHRQTLRRQRARRPKPSQTQNLCVECSVLCGSH